MAGAIISAVLGAVLLWYAGEWVTLTQDAAIVTKAFLARARVDRTQLEDFHPRGRPVPDGPYLHLQGPVWPAPGLAAAVSGLLEQDWGRGSPRIVSEGTISAKNPTIEFALDHDASTFTFEVYATDDRGHTTLNSELYRNIAANPARTPTPAPTS